jgi:starvation-inducible outer membrane lipoprotein
MNTIGEQWIRYREDVEASDPQVSHERRGQFALIARGCLVPVDFRSNQLQSIAGTA